MATAQLSASTRNSVGKGAACSLRSAGQIPAVIYGHAREPQSLAIPTRDVRATNLSVESLSSFGEDARGRVYLTSLSGPVYRLAAR